MLWHCPLQESIIPGASSCWASCSGYYGVKSGCVLPWRWHSAPVCEVIRLFVLLSRPAAPFNINTLSERNTSATLRTKHHKTRSVKIPQKHTAHPQRRRVSMNNTEHVPSSRSPRWEVHETNTKVNLKVRSNQPATRCVRDSRRLILLER